MTVTDLYASRREGAGRARAAQGGPGTGRGWSRGCSAAEGSLREAAHNMSDAAHGASTAVMHQWCKQVETEALSTDRQSFTPWI